MFCSTCIKNQHLFVASLAQYFPDDPNHPDMPKLERDYFRFRQDLESVYPQVCKDCEPRVQQRIREANYTAKTDHLRRMIEYSREVRLARSTPLDAANGIGRRLWWAGLILQLLWQAGVVSSYLLPSLAARNDSIGGDATVDTFGANVAPGADILLAVQPVLRFLVVHVGRLQFLCIIVTLASCWWNPFLVQTVRGFTRPLIGIPTWYVHQAAILLGRLMLARVAGASVANQDLGRLQPVPPTVAGAHTVAYFFILYLSVSGLRTIRKDTRSLFKEPPRESSSAPTTSAASEARQHGLETMSDVLNEILATPKSHQHASPTHSRNESDIDGWDGWQPSQSSTGSSFSSYLVGGSSTSRSAIGAGSGTGFGSLNISEADPPNPSTLQRWDTDRDDEMDWTPTQPSSQNPTHVQSPHRAFNTYKPAASNPFASPTGSFGQTPVEANRGPFWYKVPPAPTSIAQRVVNRPNAPRILGRQPDDRVGSGGSNLFGQPSGALSLDSGGLAGPAASSSIDFAQPSFFAENLRRKSSRDADDDPGSFLSDLFGRAFTLGSGGGEEDDDESSANGRDSATGREARQRTRSASRRRRQSSAQAGMGSVAVFRRLASILVITASFFMVYTLYKEDMDGLGSGTAADVLFATYALPHASVICMAAIALCAAVTLSCLGEALQRIAIGTSAAAQLSPALLILQCVMSLVLVGLMASQLWTTPAGSVEQGGAEGTLTADSSLPWFWWQMAALHTLVLGQQSI